MVKLTMEVKKQKFNIGALIIKITIILMLALFIIVMIFLGSQSRDIFSLTTGLIVLIMLLLVVAKNVLTYYLSPPILFVIGELGIRVNLVKGRYHFYQYGDIIRLGRLDYRDTLFLKKSMFVFTTKNNLTLDFKGIQDFEKVEEFAQEKYREYIKKNPNEFVINKDND